MPNPGGAKVAALPRRSAGGPIAVIQASPAAPPCGSTSRARAPGSNTTSSAITTSNARPRRRRGAGRVRDSPSRDDPVRQCHLVRTTCRRQRRIAPGVTNEESRSRRDGGNGKPMGPPAAPPVESELVAPVGAARPAPRGGLAARDPWISKTHSQRAATGGPDRVRWRQGRRS
jgi:hypothetical protein